MNNIIENIVKAIGKNIIMVTPLGAGKPNHFINQLYLYAKNNSDITLTIGTALSLNKPNGKSVLEKNFYRELNRRVFENYPDLEYEIDRSRNNLPQNIQIIEFYYPPGKQLNNGHSQQNYISSNYTHVVRDMIDRGVNLMVQMIAPEIEENPGYYSLSCNADLTIDLKKESASKNIIFIGQVNRELPYMFGDAVVEKSFFDIVIDDEKLDYAPFAPPKMSVSPADYMIGLYASSLVKDDGELQVGIGSLGDAVVYGLCLRQESNVLYNELINQIINTNEELEFIKKIGGSAPFKIGLFGATEMMVDGFMDLIEKGILKKKVYDHIGIQRLINSKEINEKIEISTISKLHQNRIIENPLTPKDEQFLLYWGFLKEIPEDRKIESIQESNLGDYLLNGHIVHAGFFLGQRKFYKWLMNMPLNQRKMIAMRSVLKINQLYNHEEIDRLHRKNARFINSTMMTTLAGAHVSDALENGKIISGIGGQFNFVSMAQELPDGRSIIVMRSTREEKGKTVSNIVPYYGHISVPKHMRDILITEYGIADLRGKTDREIIINLLKICDSRFQNELLNFAKKYNKIESTYSIDKEYLNNYPSKYETIISKYKKMDYFQSFPFGTDFTEVEIKIGRALKIIKKNKSAGKLNFLLFLINSLFTQATLNENIYLERMNLLKIRNIEEFISRKLLLKALRS